jgi:peptidoglycan/LPS O-acetylase OafA/YrhL
MNCRLHRSRCHYGLAYKYGVTFVIDPLLTAILLVQVIVFANTWAWGWLNWSVTRYVGRISYAMFLYQGVTNYWAVHMFKDRSRFVVVAVAVSLALLLGSISYYAVELSFLRLKAKFIRGGSKPSPTPVTTLVSRRDAEAASVNA